VDVSGNPIMTDNAVSTVDEPTIGIDINNDGDKTDTAVAINESNITATVAARLNGFWDNNFVTNRDFTDSQYSGSTAGRIDSSYFNNYVTPVQRRATFSEYVMEICPKRTVSACNPKNPTDWVVGYDLNGNGSFNDAVTINSNIYTENQIKANQLLKALDDAKTANPSFVFQRSKLWAGTTATAAATDSSDPLIQQYPRRVAFLRYGNSLTVARQDGTALMYAPPSLVDNKLVLDNDKTPVPLGIVSGAVKYLPFSNTLTINTVDYPKFSSSNKPDTSSNALWFRTWKTITSSTDKNYDPQYALKIENISSLTGTRATEQPLLVPVLQIQFPFQTPTDTDTLQEGQNGDYVINNGNWFQRATATETNLVFAQGDTPSRPPTTGNTGELGGGLENFIRFLENWKDRDLTARGSFIQFKRSSYATAPWQGLIADYNNDNLAYLSTSGAIFGYPQGYRVNSNNVSGKNWGRSPFYITPNRAWGFDVALLTQLPDLFSQRFTAPTLNPPNEFYREVPRDDNWVKTLLCAAQVDSTGGYDNAAAAYNVTTPTAISYKYAVSSDQRPSCP
jgi:hypothetical protein